MHVVLLSLGMILAVVLSGFIGRMLPRPVPLPLIQIALGALIASTGYFNVRLDPEIFFVLFLPPLLFLDGWHISKHKVYRDKWTILELALGLVVVTVVGMGFFIHWLIPAMPLAVAFALAAVLSPTDPVAVSSIAARVKMPRRLLHILEGESLLNDASGLVCLRFAIAAAMTGVFSPVEAFSAFIWLAFAGIACGVGVTLGVTLVKQAIGRRFGEESGTQILVSLLIPFGAYLAAEHLGGSGILAAVAAGITMSYAEASGQAMAVTRMRRNVVWDTLQFAANGVVFVLLGEQFPTLVRGAAKVVRDTGHHEVWWLGIYVLVITASLVVLRFLWGWMSVRLTMMRGVGSVDGKTRTPLRFVAVMSVAGVRGAITLAGIMTLPLLLPDGSNFPARDLAIFLAAGVIVLSLLLATIALPPLVRGLALPPEPERDIHEDRARAAAAWAAIRAIEREQYRLSEGRSDADLYTDAASRVMDSYRHRLEDELKTGQEKELLGKMAGIERQLRLAALNGERDEIFRMGRSRQIGDDLMRKLVREIDLAEAREAAPASH